MSVLLVTTKNHQTLQFFLSSYRLDDPEQRSVLVTDNFTFTTPVVNKLNFEEMHRYNLIMRNHSEHKINKIITIDDDNYIIETTHTVIENSAHYNQKIEIILEVVFVKNKIDSLVVKYEVTDHDTTIFKKILQPFKK